jgi:two-component system sensor histidine kinase ChiS
LLHADEPGPSPELERCRALRHGALEPALVACRLAADGARERGEFNAAFEALMHLAQLSTAGADADSAREALDEASLLLAWVDDPLAPHRIARRRGQLAYAAGQPAIALGRFLEALAAARAAEDRAAIAVSENDVGVVYRHLGDYPSALSHLQASLAAKEAIGESNLAATLANIGSLYRVLGDNARARGFLDRALAAQQAAGESGAALAHTIEELALLDEDEGDIEGARRGLDEAWQGYQAQGAVRERLRLALRRAELEARHRPVDAPAWIERARALGQELGRQRLLAAELIAARLADGPAALEAARASLQAALREAGESEPPVAAEAHAELARIHEALGQPARALEHLREYLRRDRALAEARHSQRLDALRVRLDLAQAESERDRLLRQTAQQDAEIGRRRAQTQALAAGSLLVLAGIVLFFQRRLFAQRLAAQLERQKLERRIEEARRAAASLRADLRSTEWLLERQQSAALVFDASGVVRAATASAAALLGQPVEQVRGQRLADVVGSAAAEWAQHSVEQASLDEQGSEPGPVHEIDGRRLRCQRLDLEEEFGLLLLAKAAAQEQVEAQAVEPGSGMPAALAAAHEVLSKAQSPESFRALLVTLMQASLDLWERLTRKTRIDLAERSGVWRITIDEGRLRVRAMDRYLSLDTLPDKPRWREVLRTAYFVLSELDLGAEQRQQLETLIEAVLAWTRRRG